MLSLRHTLSSGAFAEAFRALHIDCLPRQHMHGRARAYRESVRRQHMQGLYTTRAICNCYPLLRLLVALERPMEAAWLSTRLSEQTDV